MAGGATAFKFESTAPFFDWRWLSLRIPSMLSPIPPWSIGIRGGVACGAASEGNMPMALRYRRIFVREPGPANRFTLRIDAAGGAAGCDPAGPTDAISFAPEDGV